MIKNNLTIAWRNLLKNRFSSIINVGGLSTGMAVAMLIGLWIWDELTFDTYHKNYHRIAKVMQQITVNGLVKTGEALPLPLDAELRNSYGGDFEHIVISTMTWSHVLSAGDKSVSFPGNYMGANGPEMFSLRMIEGAHGLQDPSSILISGSVARALFGDSNALNETIMLDNKPGFKVTGVYEDLPLNSSLHGVAFIAPWEYFRTAEDWIMNRAITDWSDNFFLMYVQLADHADLAIVSEKIKYARQKRVGKENGTNPLIILHPMNKWHLYSSFTNGVNSGGAIQYVRLFGVIGIFVLLLACINFMNLSTARSEKRAKETGIRKVIGSMRSQLISQFFCESLLITLLAFFFSILSVALVLPFFNEVANKEIQILWTNPGFWMISIGFITITGLISGSYPALYLSSFQPASILKGTFKAGPLAVLQRKVLVVIQFTVSVVLIVGTIIVFQQIQFAKNRAVGYSREGLISIETSTDDLHDHFDAVRTEMLKSGMIVEVSESSSPTTGVNNNRGDVQWKGKDPSMPVDFANIRISPEYGKTVGWQFIEGRDFSSQSRTDETGLILNEAAVRYMGLANPLGEIVKVGKRELTVIGIIKDMVMSSPYEPAKPTIFNLAPQDLGYLNIKIHPQANVHDALSRIELVCKTYSPSTPFSYRFADEEYAKKFQLEQRIGKLASSFAGLAIFISCMGLFGMASFMAEQRTKEIGIRKIMGATVFTLWRTMSQDFIVLIFISLCIALPLGYYVMHEWLQNFSYHTEPSGWIFATTAAGALLITLMTVSYQSIKAAMANPVKSLRNS